jgi:hypothetical protein
VPADDRSELANVPNSNKLDDKFTSRFFKLDELIKAWPTLPENSHEIMKHKIPKGYFTNAITTTTGETKTIGMYKIDITACWASGNCAVILCFKKQ